MTKFRGLLQWFNNEVVVPTLEVMQKLIEFLHDKLIDMLKLGCTLPNLANICPHKSTHCKFYRFFSSENSRANQISASVIENLILTSGSNQK